MKIVGCFSVKGLWRDSAAFDNHLLILLGALKCRGQVGPAPLHGQTPGVINFLEPVNDLQSKCQVSTASRRIASKQWQLSSA